MPRLMVKTTCPICSREVLPRAENPTFPFCTQRCRTIDLGKWLGEEYRLVVTSPDEDDDGVLNEQPHPREDA